MAYFLQQLVNGIALGSIYALIAIGYTMVYGIIGMINFAHGDIFMVGAFIALIAFLLIMSLGLTLIPLALVLVLIIAMLLTAVWGWTVERIAYRPLRESFRLAPLITAIGMSIILQNFIQVAQGARVKPLQPVITGGYQIFDEGGFAVNFSNIQILIVVTTVALMGVFWLVITRTALGRAQRACEQDRLMAALSGVNVDRTISATFVMGAALAAVAGLLYLLYYGVIDFFIGFVAGIKAFTAAVFGGIGSLPGAMLGGLVIGLIETFWTVDSAGGLTLKARPMLLAIAVGIVFVCRLLLNLFWWNGNWKVPRPAWRPVWPIPAVTRYGSENGAMLLVIAAALFPILAFALDKTLHLGLPLRYLLDLSILVLTYVMLGFGLNIVVGLAGLLDLGYVAFYAVGAYTLALLAVH